VILVSISEKKISHVFKLMFTTKKSGYGLGLYFVRMAVEAHGGTVECTLFEGLLQTHLPMLNKISKYGEGYASTLILAQPFKISVNFIV
jgi:signal transduction histidine kinase